MNFLLREELSVRKGIFTEKQPKGQALAVFFLAFFHVFCYTLRVLYDGGKGYAFDCSKEA